MQGSRREPLALRHSALTFWVVTGTVFVVDQVVKAVVRASMIEGQTRTFLDGLLHLTYVRNVGAAFGLLPGYQPVFIATSCVVLLAIAAYWRRSRPTAWPIVVALGLITGGAAGNLIDRVAMGRVTDMFEFAMFDFPVFNVADAALVAGVGILIVWMLIVPEREPMDEHEDGDGLDSDEPQTPGQVEPACPADAGSEVRSG